MRAAVQKAKKLALDVEDRDRPLVDGDEFARARRQLVHRGNDVSGHVLLRMIFFEKPVSTHRVVARGHAFSDHAKQDRTASAHCRDKTRRGWRRKHLPAAPATARHNPNADSRTQTTVCPSRSSRSIGTDDRAAPDLPSAAWSRRCGRLYIPTVCA